MPLFLQEIAAIRCIGMSFFIIMASKLKISQAFRYFAANSFEDFVHDNSKAVRQIVLIICYKVLLCLYFCSTISILELACTAIFLFWC